MEEEWRDIKGYEGLYQVSNLGRVKSTFRYKKVLTPVETPRGYYQVTLSKKGKRGTFRIHQLVAKAFIPNVCNLPQINHKNENKKDNRVENLEWCNAKYNLNYGTVIERRRKNRSYESVQKAVVQIKNGVIIREFPSVASVGRELGLGIYAPSNIVCACKKYPNKKAYGYQWKYKEV